MHHELTVYILDQLFFFNDYCHIQFNKPVEFISASKPLIMLTKSIGIQITE